MQENIQVKQITIKEETRWNDLISNAVNGSFRQSFPFEYAQELNGREITTFIFEKEGVDIAGVHYSIKGSYNNFITIADILSGFVFREEPNQELLAFLIEHFICWAKKRQASYIRINSWLPKKIAGKETYYHNFFGEEMDSFGFSNILSGRHTYWIDLCLSEDELLKRLKPTTRNKVRKGEKSELLVEKYDYLDERLIELFWSLYGRLGKLKGFHTLNRDRFELEIVSVVNHGLANSFFTWFKGHVVNVTVVGNFGQSNYYYGAMDPGFKDLAECPSPGPYTQWEIIKAMKTKGVEIYDMGFCPGPIPIKEDPRYTIWRYKYDFGGDHVEFMPTFGKVLKPIRGRLFQYIRYKK
jgi:lipid II:glycine glycyltransferase (peptidoglycan interpeptide bridge formation enzyme)